MILKVLYAGIRGIGDAGLRLLVCLKAQAIMGSGGWKRLCLGQEADAGHRGYHIFITY